MAQGNGDQGNDGQGSSDDDAVPAIWPQPDGEPVSCREKLVVLRENYVELHDVMRDAFEDAILMGVDEAQMRRILIELVGRMRSPHA
ncbi:hypothetical protein [Novacetimonas pomaceti]|uniref:Uncharacterized protein n=1 Tax=Novacetimonas pomaceti TaxID=2021998 RepID=A0A318QFK4_9PROT|nr:hypothetical protein [Novacetimonas pomaceti]MBV1834991.1 hypothetical protein [Novacetimonas pomaceti]PYD47024.1 hypothetical protein C3920_11895 [Novacetimonas pomaceti]PYD76138.1 hypothetical protein CFR71_04515 [Novacetimonas pomaceti]